MYKTNRETADDQFALVLPSDVSDHSTVPAQSDYIFTQNGWEKKSWTCYVSKHADKTVNPIRRICDALSVPTCPGKYPIRLNLGDPTLTGALKPSPLAVQAIKTAVESHEYDGYNPAVGKFEARLAVAQFFSHPCAPITPDDVILANGCSHALQIAIEALANPGDNILVPCPGFPLYSTLMRPHNIEDRAYPLDMFKSFQIDLAKLESLIDNRTKAILVNNPGNPTGTVFSKEHLEDLLKIAYKHRLPVIADEVYGDLTYDDTIFHPLARLQPYVPILTCDAISKRYLVPGWRLGWVIIHNRYEAFKDVRKGMVSLAQKIVGPCSLIQGALPTMLNKTPDDFFANIKRTLMMNAKIAYELLNKITGLKPVKPNGAMYMMVKIDKEYYGDENSFVQELITEQSVICLPGSVFNCPGWFRIVLTYPEHVTTEACNRIAEFCSKKRSRLM